MSNKSDTPRTDAASALEAFGTSYVLDLCRRFERELAAANERIVAQQARIEELVASVETNDRWHRENDEYGGYPDSEIESVNYSALAIKDDLSALHARDAEMQAKALEEAADWFSKEEPTQGWITGHLKRMAAERRGHK